MKNLDCAQNPSRSATVCPQYSSAGRITDSNLRNVTTLQHHKVVPGQYTKQKQSLLRQEAFHVQLLYRCPRTIARHENGPLAESRRRYLEYLAAQGAAIHTIRAAAGVIYRATILMKLDGSSPVERKNVQRAAKRWAHRWYRNASSRGPEQTDKESGRQHATGCVSQAGCENQIVLHHRISRRLMHSVATWKWSGDFRRQQSQPSDTT